MPTKQGNVLEYGDLNGEGKAFVAAIKEHKPRAVHIAHIGTEHGDNYYLRFIDRQRIIHGYGENVEEWASPVIGKDGLKNFASLYGAPLVAGMVEYKHAHVYHSFDLGYFGGWYFTPNKRTTLAAWKKSIDDVAEALRTERLHVQDPSASEGLSLDAEVLFVEKKQGKILEVRHHDDHYVLKSDAGKDAALVDRARKTLNLGVPITDITSYVKRAEQMGD